MLLLLSLGSGTDMGVFWLWAHQKKALGKKCFDMLREWRSGKSVRPVSPALIHISVWRLHNIKDKSEVTHLPKITDIKCLISALLWLCHRFPGTARWTLFSIFLSPSNMCRRNREWRLLSLASSALKSHLALRRAQKDQSIAVRFVLPEPPFFGASGYGDVSGIQQMNQSVQSRYSFSYLHEYDLGPKL